MDDAHIKHAGQQQPCQSSCPSQLPSNDADAPSRTAEQSDRQRRRNRQNRFGSNESSRAREDTPDERRDVKQESEARVHGRESVARQKEHERSMKVEQVDGGYLVTLGTYPGPEDFDKQIVRQLQIERKIAPFWRGLADKEDGWTEHQLVCASRGLPIPSTSARRPPEFSPKSPASDNQNMDNPMVSIEPKSRPIKSNGKASTIDTSSSPASPRKSNTQRNSFGLKTPAKALAAVLCVGRCKNSSSDLTPCEIKLPNDPVVNGQPLEVALYKNALECPLCLLYYPPYLNHTVCCDQPICTECFVQIKRPDLHFPEYWRNIEAQNMPTKCPYCQHTELSLTYKPPPFRRGLTYGVPPDDSKNMALPFQNSLNSTMSPGMTPLSWKRSQNLSSNIPNIITTDHIRPRWSNHPEAPGAHHAPVTS